MEPEIFRATTNFLRWENLLCDTRGVAIEEQLGMFMYILSHNASTDMICKAFQHSGETIHRKISEVFDIIPALTHRFVRLPSDNHTHPKIAAGPHFMPFFQVRHTNYTLRPIYPEAFLVLILYSLCVELHWCNRWHTYTHNYITREGPSPIETEKEPCPRML
jgi:hypothetical protein